MLSAHLWHVLCFGPLFYEVIRPAIVRVRILKCLTVKEKEAANVEEPVADLARRHIHLVSEGENAFFCPECRTETSVI